MHISPMQMSSPLHCGAIVSFLSLPEQVERKGIGVIGVIECNFLQPTHNKQDFDDTDKYRFLRHISMISWIHLIASMRTISKSCYLDEVVPLGCVLWKHV